MTNPITSCQLLKFITIIAIKQCFISIVFFNGKRRTLASNPGFRLFFEKYERTTQKVLASVLSKFSLQQIYDVIESKISDNPEYDVKNVIYDMNSEGGPSISSTTRNLNYMDKGRHSDYSSTLEDYD